MIKKQNANTPYRPTGSAPLSVTPNMLSSLAQQRAAAFGGPGVGPSGGLPGHPVSYGGPGGVGTGVQPGHPASYGPGYSAPLPPDNANPAGPPPGVPSHAGIVPYNLQVGAGTQGLPNIHHAPSGGSGLGSSHPGPTGLAGSRPSGTGVGSPHPGQGAPGHPGHGAPGHPGGQGTVGPKTINGTPLTPAEVPLYLSGGKDAINAATRDYTTQMANSQHDYGTNLQHLGYSTSIDPKTGQLVVGGIAQYGDNKNGAYQTVSRDALNQALMNGAPIGSGIDTRSKGYQNGMDQIAQDKTNADYGFAGANQSALNNYNDTVAKAYSDSARWGVDHPEILGTPSAAASAKAAYNAGGRYFPVNSMPGGPGGSRM